ncbi:ABC transporter ATP-binding protein [Kocuria sp.]|uniref:ABC transporter ATP-binding protein n=1 Tax=Kocuria sp. TaxID=1871328 RepID=UPI0026DD5B41|nr:ABC transporter ATP-binding protein [Kocuria sp.]MDO4920149.1 ABC transporter ATP-binding protein [Kocuria sp.]
MNQDRVLLPVATGRQILHETRRLARGRGCRLGAVVVLFAVDALLVLAVPLIVGRAVDATVAGDTTRLVGAVAGLVLSAVLVGCVQWLARWQTARLVEPAVALLREEFVDSVLGMPRQRVDAAGGGDVLSRATADVTELSENAATVLPRLVSLVLTLVTVALTLGALDPRYLLAVVVVLPLTALTMRWYLGTGPRTYAAERRALAERGRHVLDTFRAERTVRAYHLEQRQLHRVRDASWVHVRWAMRARVVQNILLSRVTTAEGAGLAAVLCVSLWIAATEDTTAGALTAGILLFLRIVDPVSELLFVSDDLQSAASAMGRVVGVVLEGRVTRGGQPRPCVPAGSRAGGAPPLDRTPSPEGHRGPAPLRGPGRDSASSPPVQLQGVGLRYGDGPEVLRAVDLVLQPGEHVALVGATGSGKTTLGGVVAGLLQPTAGRRLAAVPDGRIATVTQETHVFSASLRENLLLADPGADDERLVAVLRELGADTLLQDCGGSLDTVLGAGGIRLEPAAAQQLALVRMALAEPELVVLDEATAEAGSVDARTLEETAFAAIRGRAALVVAHRLSQAQRCDRVVVLEGGEVLECGPHEELVARGGRYARLWAAWQGRDPAGGATADTRGGGTG